MELLSLFVAGFAMLVIAPTSNAETPEFIIESCLKDEGNLSQVLSHKLAAITEVMRLSEQQRSPAPCAAACSSLGFDHAGIRNDYECWCGEQTRFTAFAKCTRCQGNETHLCGGLGVISLYDLKPAWPRFKYNGCFRYETPADIATLLPHSQWTTTEAAHWSHHLRQPAVCVKWCLDKGYRFAGWTQFYECHCGSFVPDVTEASCDPCFADRRYLCGGRSQIAVYEVVQSPPRATICGGVNHTAVVGYPIGLHCTASGDDPVVLAWHRMRGDKTKPLGESSQILEVTGDLYIKEVKDTDAGVYACEASNENMLSENQRSNVRHANLRVQSPPSVQLELDNNGKELVLGDEATLRCQVDGDSPLIMQWYFQSQRLDLTLSSKYGVRNEAGSAVVNLVIYNITKQDLGGYECEATNPKIVLPQARVSKDIVELIATNNHVTVPVTEASDNMSELQPAIVVHQTGVGLSVGVLVPVLVQCIVIAAVMLIFVVHRYKQYVDDDTLYSGETVRVNPVAADKSNISAPIQQPPLVQQPPPKQPSETRRAVVYMDEMDESLASPPAGGVGPNSYIPSARTLPRNGTNSLPRLTPSQSNSRWSLNSNLQVNYGSGTQNNNGHEFYSVPPDHRVSRSISREAGV